MSKEETKKLEDIMEEGISKFPEKTKKNKKDLDIFREFAKKISSTNKS